MARKAQAHVTHHGSERDQTDEGEGREQAQTDGDSITKCLQLLQLFETSVYDEEKYGWDLGRSG